MRGTGAAAVSLLVAAAIAGCGSAKGGTTNNTTVVVGAPTKGPIQVYRVPAGSMEPTYAIGGRVLVQPGAPAVGRIVLFHPPEGAEQSQCGEPSHPATQACPRSNPQADTSIRFIKRVVAGPGDSLYIKEGHVYRKAAGTTNYVKASEPYIKRCEPQVGLLCNLTTPVTVPDGEWFVLGDNRGESDDSRFWGPVPTASIVGVPVGPE